MTDQAGRGQWKSRFGFVLAAAGSAVGLGNIWKFPYITGENGGGLFVLIYLVCILAVALPVLYAEILIGRAAQRAPIGAFKLLSNKSMWWLVGLMGVITGFLILSYYSVVAGWAMHYVWLEVSGAFVGAEPDAIAARFGEVYTSTGVNLFWHSIFMCITIVVVFLGVGKGIERAAKVLMPTLLVLMLVLFGDALFQKGFGAAARFLFSPNLEKLSGAGVLEALGHSFFTLSVGMGAMITYGSYLSRDTDVVKAGGLVAILDTGVAVLACLIFFPITFTFGMPPEAGPGLVFKSIPIALSQMAGGRWLGVIFFVLLFFAALTSAISLLEVVVSSLIDEKKWTRHRAAILMGVAILLLGVPAALSGTTELFGAQFAGVFGKNWFDLVDYLCSNWFLPLGGLFIALYVGFAMPAEQRKYEYTHGSSLGGTYGVWLFFLRWVAPVGIGVLAIFKIFGG
jgi:NSS family neurotransmitter:Na+ symporter